MARNKENENNVVNYRDYNPDKRPERRPERKTIDINLGLIIFGFIFVYVVIVIFLSFTEKNIKGYVVTEGSLSSNLVYTGIALREESLVPMDQAGYINFFVKEGDRVGLGDFVHTIDETGKLNELYSGSEEDMSLSESDLNNLKSQLVNFSYNFDPTNFVSTYDFKNSISNTILKLSGNTLLKDIDQISAQQGVVITKKYAPQSGIVVYWYDGFENMNASQLTDKMIGDKSYSKQYIVDNDILKNDDTAYKLITSDIWSVYIPMDFEDGSKICEDEEGYVKVKFIKNQYESWASISMIKTESGDSFMKLEFNNSMITFYSDRFLEVELLINDEKGLKVPNSAIIDKQFFIVPADYITKAGNGVDGVLRRTYLEDGSMSSEFIESPIYMSDDTTGEVYLEMDELRSGDVLIKPDSMETMGLGKTGTLTGVYNINKGYADFRRIEKLYENEEYSIVRSNTMYGLCVYDYIVLDATTVTDDEILYE